MKLPPPNDAQRIALVLPSLKGGGAERVTVNLAQGLAKRGVAVDMVLASAEGPFLKEVPPAARVFDLRRSSMSASVLPLARYLRSERPSAVISALDWVNVLVLIAVALSRVKTKTVVASHIHLSTALVHYRRWQAVAIPFLMRRTYPHAHGIVAVSAGVADDLAKLASLPRERIRVIFNPVIGIDVLEKARLPADKDLLPDDSRPLCVAVGRLYPQKDYPTLIRAFAKLRARRPARLVILGEGEERQRLVALIKDLGMQGNVTMPGFAANPYALMSRAAVFVLSSQWEALPTVLIEAMACGVPVVATDCPSGPREILEDGQHGRLVPVGDVDALAFAMEAALEGKVPKPSLESWRRFEIDQATSCYLELLSNGR